MNLRNKYEILPQTLNEQSYLRKSFLETTKQRIISHILNASKILISLCTKKPVVSLVTFGIASLLFLILIHKDSILEHSSIRLTRRKTSKDNLDNVEYFDILQNNQSPINDLKFRINELKRIKSSFMFELVHLEREKSKLVKEKLNLQSRNEKLISQIARSKSHLKQLEIDIYANRKQKFEHICDDTRIAPTVFMPLEFSDLRLQQQDTSIKQNLPHNNQIDYQNDLSYCPLVSDFKFHLSYNSPKSSDINPVMNEEFSFEKIASIFRSHRQYTNNATKACLNIILLYEIQDDKKNLFSHRNNLVIDFTDGLDKNETILHEIQHKAAVVTKKIKINSFRPSVDIIMPSTWNSDYEHILDSFSSQSPIRRRYLASYFSNPGKEINDENTKILIETLKTIHRTSIDDNFLFKYACKLDSIQECLSNQIQLMESSSFTIILPPQDNFVADEYTTYILCLALLKGTIPVIVGKEEIVLPFSNVIDWRRASIMIPTSRCPELHFILSSISHQDQYKMKYHGRFIFERYLATASQIIDTIVSTISLDRMGYPPLPVMEFKDHDFERFYPDYKPTKIIANESETEEEEYQYMPVLGPRENKFPSARYLRNISLTLSSTYDLWNDLRLSPFKLYPQTPLDPVAPSEYKFIHKDVGYRPINEGLGGSGEEFSKNIGGDYPNEQFTIIIVTFERQSVLLSTLSKLKGLPYLNKIIVVWNSLKPPNSDIQWPQLDVPLIVINPKKNSLNNRFIPYHEIETEAVLSLDDDSPLRQDEIVFAFRVWRESRMKIVGFPGRYHAWDSYKGLWQYNSNHSCEISMVLTGGAFFHVYYLHIYTYQMPETIRLLVDKFMNCEDIAMNFLVAHITREPPIKVTSRWTFHCAQCPSSLSEDESHFLERHECLNAFSTIYGYMPLLNTQHRADSILFKTRIPADKQKCFKFV